MVLKIKFNKFNKADSNLMLTLINLFFFKKNKIKYANEPTMIREKPMQDTLSATGVATLHGNWVHVFINNEVVGLFLMIDDNINGFYRELDERRYFHRGYWRYISM
ncbi:hypothetical protein BD408DRAFT_459777 [Parasitella parasitica]|nr:hypothetical protein BD408DRAFT_459777 [Parasitella parasitica]